MSATDRSLLMKQPHELSRCCPGTFGVLIVQLLFRVAAGD